MSKGKNSIDMCSGSLWDKILLFALPLMLSSILQLLFNAADVVVVGRYAGNESLAAVGSTTPVIQLVVNLFTGLSVGANVLVARDIGAGNHQRVSRCVHTAILLAFTCGIVMAAISSSIAGTILTWTSSPTDVIGLATLYLRIYFLGIPATMVYNFGAAILRARGDTRRPLYYLTVSGVINVGLNLFFVICLEMDVAGVALATIISQYVSAGLVVWCLMREESSVHLDLKKLRFDGTMVLQILQVGLPAGIQSSLFSISNVAIQTGLNSFDDSTLLAACSASLSIEGFLFVGTNSFHQAAISFVGQNYGAGNRRRTERCVLLCMAYTTAVGLLTGNLAYLFGETLVGFYAPGETEVIALAMVRLAYFGYLYFLCGVQDTMAGALRGLGYSLLPTILSLLSICAFRLVWINTAFVQVHTPETLYLSYPVSWALATALQVGAYFLVRKRAFYKIMPKEKADA